MAGTHLVCQLAGLFQRAQLGDDDCARPAQACGRTGDEGDSDVRHQLVRAAAVRLNPPVHSRTVPVT